MQYVKMTKRQRRDARRMHQYCERKDRANLRNKRHLDRVEAGIYRIGA